MFQFLKYTSNTKLIFLLSTVIAFVIPNWSDSLKPLLVPILIVMMTISIKDLKFHKISKKQTKTVLKLLAANYIFLTGFMILYALLFIKNIEYQKGMIIYALMPPAVGILSLTYLLKSDIKIAFITEIAGYLLSVIIAPTLGYLIYTNSINPIEMIKVLVYVIIIPYLLSRILHKIEEKNKPMDKKIIKTIINACYAISFYVIIGVNRDVFFTDPIGLIPIIIMILIMKFGIGTLIFFALRKNTPKKIDTLYVLFGTFKNGGAATAITVILFGTTAAVPLAITAIFTSSYILYLQWLIPEH